MRLTRKPRLIAATSRSSSITADSGGSATSLAISPDFTTSGRKQNVTAYPTNTGAVVKVGAGVSETLVAIARCSTRSLCVRSRTVDLDVCPSSVDGERQRMDGLSMRLWRQYDIVNDKIPCRLDVLYGYKTIRYHELAAASTQR
jgi:hypothetical protein